MKGGIGLGGRATKQSGVCVCVDSPMRERKETRRAQGVHRYLSGQ